MQRIGYLGVTCVSRVEKYYKVDEEAENRRQEKTALANHLITCGYGSPSRSLLVRNSIDAIRVSRQPKNLPYDQVSLGSGQQKNQPHSKVNSNRRTLACETSEGSTEETANLKQCPDFFRL